MTRRSRFLRSWVGIAVASLLLGGCPWSLPITSKPTRQVDARLVGDWFSVDDGERLLIRKLDDWQYVLYFDKDVYRGTHTDVGSLPLVSIQQLGGDRKYSYFGWSMAEDGSALILRTVSTEVIPSSLETSEQIAEAIAAHEKDPLLFKDEQRFARVRR